MELKLCKGPVRGQYVFIMAKLQCIYNIDNNIILKQQKQKAKRADFSSTIHMNLVQNAEFDWLPWQHKGYIFEKILKNLRNHKADEAETLHTCLPHGFYVLESDHKKDPSIKSVLWADLSAYRLPYGKQL